MAYATADQLRLFMRHPSAFTDEETDQAELLIELAEGAIEDETGQSLELSEDTVVLDGPTRSDRRADSPGTGSRKLILPRWPVTAVASVTWLRDDADDEILTEGTDEDFTWSAAGILTRVGAWWPTADRSTEVVYTAGHAPLPKGVRRIVLRLASAGWGNPSLLASETLGDHSRSWSADVLGMELTGADKKTLGYYRART